MSSYGVFLHNSSPLFNYYPYGDPYSIPDLNAGWAPWNNISGLYDPSKNQSNFIEANYFHRVQQDSAIVELYFKGSNIRLLGNADQCGYDIWLDGKTSSGSLQDGALATFSNLDEKQHRILVTVHPTNNGSMSFYGAQLDIAVPSHSISSQLDVSVEYGADWTSVRTALGQYHEATKLGASVNFTIHQSSAVTVFGAKGLDAGRYNVSVDGDTPNTYIAKSAFALQSALFSAVGLDPNVDHYVVLSNIEEGAHLRIASVNVTTVTGTSSPAFTVPSGTAIALITATVICLLVLAALLIWLFLRHRKRNQKGRQRTQQWVIPRTITPIAPSLPKSGAASFDSHANSYVMVETDRVLPRAPINILSSSRGDDDEETDSEDDGSYHLVQRPLLSTPSLKLPSLGEDFHVDFPNVSSVQSHSRKSSKRSKLSTRSSNHHQSQEGSRLGRRESSDQTNFLHLMDSSGSTGTLSREPSSPTGKHRSKVRFSTPPSLLLKHPYATAGNAFSRSAKGLRRASRSPDGQEPASPLTMESVPFTVGTSVSFEHPESTASPSEENAIDEASSEPRNTQVTDALDQYGFIPHSGRTWPDSG